MWIVLKFDKKKYFTLREDLKNKLGQDVILYAPKILVERIYKKKIVKKEYNILGDYLFCYHKKLSSLKNLELIKFSKGLKYFLSFFKESQSQIEDFIEKCKKTENNLGYISSNFYNLYVSGNYKFKSGPFNNQIFKILRLNKNRIDILIGDMKTCINKRKFLFSPI